MRETITDAALLIGAAVVRAVILNRTVAAIAVPIIAAVILAAGSSRRFGHDNKLAATIDGRSLLARTVDAALASQVTSVIVVVSPTSQSLLDEFAPADVVCVINDDLVAGMSRSLELGLQILPDTVDGAVILLADMPFVSARIIDTLVAGFAREQAGVIVVPVSHGRRGNPVLWPARYFEDIKGLSGDRGARALLGVHAEHVCEVDIDDEAIFIDVDTREILGVVRERAGPWPGA
ncbi:MAG: nucleotidyltransferase family protein [Halioglobus sp.]